jgi:hypothetical protein
MTSRRKYYPQTLVMIMTNVPSARETISPPIKCIDSSLESIQLPNISWIFGKHATSLHKSSSLGYYCMADLLPKI